MNITDFREFTIQAVPSKTTNGALDYVIASETRTQVIRGTTQVNESVDNFLRRVRSNLKALENAPIRQAPTPAKPVTTPPTWDETKAALKQEKGA